MLISRYITWQNRQLGPKDSHYLYSTVYASDQTKLGFNQNWTLNWKGSITQKSKLIKIIFVHCEVWTIEDQFNTNISLLIL